MICLCKDGKGDVLAPLKCAVQMDLGYKCLKEDNYLFSFKWKDNFSPLGYLDLAVAFLIFYSLCDLFSAYKWLRPCHSEYNRSCPITEVKQGWAVLVLGWVTAWEYTVL